MELFLSPYPSDPLQREQLPRVSAAFSPCPAGRSIVNDARALLTRTSALWLAVLLTACAGTAPQQSSAPSSGSRYELENDVPLLETFDLSRIRPVEPKVEKRTLAGNKSPYTINGRTYRVMATEQGYSETGMASWYGRKFHGHLTSNGEIYDMFQLSAAHTTLPIPSYIRVTNLDNGKSIIARVNDRGPFHPGRIVDLSYAGAVMLGYAGNGTARVRVDAIVPGANNAAPVVAAAGVADAAVVANTGDSTVAAAVPLPQTGQGQAFLQVGAFASIDSARSLVERLSVLTSMPVFIHSETADEGILHKVRIGPVVDSAREQELIDTLQSASLGTPFIVRI